MSFFSSKSELAIVFHIGSSSVAAGLVRLQHGKIAHVIYTIREEIAYRDTVDAERFLNDMILALKRVNARLAKEGIVHLKFTEFGSLLPQRIYYVFSSPWAVTQTKVASIIKPDGFIMTKELIDNVVREQEQIFETEMLGQADLADKLQTIEKRVIQIKLNGYEVENPHGKKATRADISLFMSLIPKAVVDKVFDVSMSTYHPKNTEMSSFPLASFSTLREVFHSQKDFIFIDVGGELSDISIIRDGVIIETASFPLGRHFLVRKVAKAFAMSPEATISLIRMYYERHAETSVDVKLKPVMEQASVEWSTALHTTLSGVSLKVALPTHLFTIINNDFVDFFMTSLTAEKVTEFGMRETPLSVTLINHDTLRSVVEFGKNAHKDPFIAVLASFIERVYESKTK